MLKVEYNFDDTDIIIYFYVDNLIGYYYGKTNRLAIYLDYKGDEGIVEKYLDSVGLVIKN